MTLEEFRSYCKKYQTPLKKLSFNEINHDIYLNQIALNWNSYFPDIEVTELYKEVHLFKKNKNREIGDISYIDLVLFNHNNIFLIEAKSVKGISKSRFSYMKQQLKKQYNFVLDNFNVPAYRIGIFGKLSKIRKIIIPPYLEDIVSS
ncbi:MAG: hypothetical protein WC867_02940 [Candidatus Pacearchaeota archaeon]|jgi:hypothetical protein